MSDLFGNVAATPRPTRFTDEMFRRVAKKLVPEVASWIRQGGSGEFINCEEIEQQLYEVIEDGGFEQYDAYHLAKDLEDKSWMVDREMVEILDQVSSLLYEEQAEAIRNWVKANNITPKFAKGAAVKFYRRSERMTGTVVAIHEDTAQYVVNVPELGHVPPAEIGRRNGTTGTYVPFEEAEALNA